MAKKKRGAIEAIPRSHWLWIIIDLALFFILVFGGPMKAFGATYYVMDSVTFPQASDGNNGETWGQPFATISRLQNAMVGGDTAFMHGTWEDVQLVPPSGASFGDRTAYISANGKTTTPTIGDAHIYGGKLATGWTNISGNIYRCQFTQVGGEEPYSTFTDVTVSGCWQDTTVLTGISSYGDLSEGEYYWTDAGDDSLYVYLNDIGGVGYDPANYTIYATHKIPIQMAYHDNLDYVTFYGLDVRYGGRKGIMFGGSYHHDSVFIDHCIIRYVSGGGANNIASVSSMSNNSSDISTYGHYNRIRACSLSNVWNHTSNNMEGTVLYCEMYITTESCYVYTLESGVNNKGAPVQRTGDVTKFNTIVNCEYGIARDGAVDIDSVYGNIVVSNRDNARGYVNDFHPGTYGMIYIYNNTFHLKSSTGDGIVFGATDGYNNTFPDSNYVKYNIIYSANGDEAYIDKYDDSVLLSDSNIFYTSWSFRNSLGSGDTAWWEAQGYDTHSDFNVAPSFVDTSSAVMNYARTDSLSADMNLTYGGKTWTKYGAIQPSGSAPPEPGTRYKIRMKK